MAHVIDELSHFNDDATTYIKAQRKTPTQTLIRVRNNQCRHRERRREYTASLEQRLAETEKLLTQANANIDDLKKELDEWKCTSNGTGERFGHSTLTLENTGFPRLSSPVQTQYTEAEQICGILVDEGRETFTRPSNTKFYPETALEASVSRQDISPPVSTIFHFNVTNTSNKLAIPSPQQLPPSLAIQKEYPLDFVPSAFPSACCTPVDELPTASFTALLIPDSQDFTLLPSTYESYPASDVDSTTLCSQAYYLITQQNFRGLNALSIRSWLDPGFRRSNDQDEGCRVDNMLLFGLLEFISGV